mmetsp:Transcript_63038/g.117951  ORF Transcript_63038/g.117951 Transcript_63038/m.117951 type:complete len:238 (-) Transcript_63038:475-1188(-)
MQNEIRNQLGRQTQASTGMGPANIAQTLNRTVFGHFCRCAIMNAVFTLARTLAGKCLWVSGVHCAHKAFRRSSRPWVRHSQDVSALPRFRGKQGSAPAQTSMVTSSALPSSNAMWSAVSSTWTQITEGAKPGALGSNPRDCAPESSSSSLFRTALTATPQANSSAHISVLALLDPHARCRAVSSVCRLKPLSLKNCSRDQASASAPWSSNAFTAWRLPPSTAVCKMGTSLLPSVRIE